MFTVTSTNVDWRIEKDIAWVTPDQTDGIASATVVLTYQANPTANPRDGTITFRSNTGSPPITVVIDVSQAGRASRVLSINTNSVDLPSTMGSSATYGKYEYTLDYRGKCCLDYDSSKYLEQMLRR